MISCKYVDSMPEIELVRHIDLITDLEKAGYSSIDNIKELLQYYLEEMPVRIEKSNYAEKFPDLAYYGKHLIEVKKIVI